MISYISRGLSSKKIKKKLRTSIIAYLFILPALVIFIMIILIPTLETFYLSTLKWDGVNPNKVFVGFDNYLKAFTDPGLHNALVHNLIWMIFRMPIPVLIGLLLAVAITKKGIKGRDKWQAAYFIPFVLATVVVALIWRWIYSSKIGILTWLLQTLHIVDKPYGILGDSRFALYALILIHIWRTYGFCTVIYVVGLQGIDQSLYGAAMLDGANAWQRFRFITIPGVSAVTTFVILLSMIDAFKVFNIVFLTTVGGPGSSTEVVTLYIYKQSFFMNRVGYGSTVAVFLTLILVAFGIVFVSRREKKEVAE